jgi:hypothetical protein
MGLKILISVLCFQSFFNSTCCEFDNDSFFIFVNSLYSRNTLDENNNVLYLYFSNANDERLFVKKIKLKRKTICIKKSKKGNEENLLIVNSILKNEKDIYSVNFRTGSRSGKSYFGTIEIGFSNSKPVFIDSHIVSQIE